MSPAASLFAMPLLVLLGMIGIMYVAIGLMVTKELSEKTSVRVEARAAILARRMAVAIDTHKSKLELLAWTLGQVGLQDSPLIREQLQEVRRRSQAIVWLGVTRLDGQVLIATDKALEGSSIASRPVFMQGKDTIYFGDFHAPVALASYLRTLGNRDQLVADLGLPIRDRQGHTIGVLTSHLSGDWFAALGHGTVTEAETLQTGLSWHLTLANGETLPRALPFGSEHPVVADGKVVRIETPQNHGYLASMRQVPLGTHPADPAWKVTVVQDIDMATSSARQIRNNLGLTAIGAALLLGGIAFFASWNTTHSVTRILEAAQKGFDAAGGSTHKHYRHYLEDLAEQLAGADQDTDLHSGDLLRRLASDAQRFKAVIDHFPVSIAVASNLRDLQYVNPAFTELFGWTLEQVQGRPASTFLGNVEASPSSPWYLALRAEPPGEWVMRFRATCADGRSVPVQWQVIPLVNRHGVTEGFMSLAQDLSAETAQRQRADSLAHRLQVFGNAARNYALILLDKEGRVMEWSRGADNIMGMGRSQAMGRDLASFMAQSSQNQALSRQYLALASAKGFAPIDARFCRPDGRCFAGAGELYFTNESQGLIGYALVLSDVTQAREAAERLTRSEARLNAVIAGASDAVISTDAQGIVQLFNPAAERIFKVGAEAAMGRSLEWLIPASKGSQHTLKLQEFSADTTRQGPMGSGKVEGLRADGQKIELEASISKAQVKGQWVMTAILRDVTESAKAERALVQYQIELSALAQRLLLQEKDTTQRLAQVLHDDLGQTLAAQRLIYDAGIGQLSGPDASLGWIRKLDRLIVDANVQVRQVLTQLRPPLLTEEGLYAALDNEFQQVRQMHEEQHLQLNWVGPDKDLRFAPEVEYAAFMIAREALNNAVRHSGANQVELQVHGSRQHLLLDMRDDGRGDEELVKRSRPGHLGLVSMRERAAAIGARLEIHSSAQSGTHISMTWGHAA